jgi:hypothetical protein
MALWLFSWFGFAGFHGKTIEKPAKGQVHPGAFCEA